MYCIVHPLYTVTRDGDLSHLELRLRCAAPLAWVQIAASA